MSIGDIIRAGIKAGKTTEAILADVLKQYPQANTKAASVAWYRSQMKKGGDAPPKAKPTATAKAAKALTGPAAHMDAETAAKILKPQHQGHDFVPGKGFVPKGEKLPDEVLYEVRGIKGTTGIEGKGFIASLYRNGKRVAEVADYGDGAICNHWTWLDKDAPAEVVYLDYKEQEQTRKGTREEAMLWLFCRQLPRYTNPWDKDGETHAMTPDIFVDDLVNEVELAKQLRRLTKGQVATLEDGNLYTRKTTNVAATIAKVKAENPNVIVLNGMDEKEAITLLKKLQQ